jgi:hypothetical protein
MFTGAPKSQGAFLALGIFVIGTLLHIAFDRRNRSGGRERRGIDFFGGE